MVRLLILLLISGFINAAPDFAQDEFIRANEFMKTEDFQSAVTIYENLLGQGYQHPDLYYNLGNGYFKQGKYGFAIWAYETGLRYAPLDKDIAFNLRLSETRIKDRIKEPETFVLLKFYRSIKYQMHIYDGLLVGSLLMLLSALVIIIRKFNNYTSSITSRVAVVLFILSLIVHGITLDKYWGLSSKVDGVVVVPECSAYSIPLERPESTVFVLHEGTKGVITQEQDGWAEIELIDGNKGWVRTSMIRKI